MDSEQSILREVLYSSESAISDELVELFVPSPAQDRPNPEIKAVAIALVKNEGDILAAWLSHVTAIFDRIYIADHQSIDGTREYLFDRAKNRTDIHAFSFDHPAFFQQEITNHLAYLAAEECPSAWMFPLDADEFLAIRSRKSLLETLIDAPTNKFLRMHWRNCIPIKLSEDESFELALPLLVSPDSSVYKKIAIHTSAFKTLGWRFFQGNHELRNNSNDPIPDAEGTDACEIRHIPIRSNAHFVLKCTQGYLAYKALPRDRQHKGQGYHWKEMVGRVAKAGTLRSDIIRGFVAHYGRPNLSPSVGISVYGLIDAGWVCKSLEGIGSELLAPIDRRNDFIQLAKRIGPNSADPVVKNFLSATRSTNEKPSEVRLQRPRTDAGDQYFESLPAAATLSYDAENTWQLPGDLLTWAFTPHELPLPSTWESHVPFMLSLIGFCRPRRFVELGSHYGNSFFAACQASQQLGVMTECIAIDTWRGDEHTGEYDEEVFRQFTYLLETKYPGLAKYIRRSFDDANSQFADKSIDLLHIDGLHTYEAISHDYHTWLPKLAKSGIILFHDTQVRDDDFGVWRLWGEIEDKYASFEFEHGHGLGILFLGHEDEPRLSHLHSILKDPSAGPFLEIFFRELGALSPIRSGSAMHIPRNQK